MKFQVALLLACAAVLSNAMPADIVNFETDNMEVEQEGTPGKAVEGEYSWVAPNGEEYSVKYIADHLGYRVVETNAQPSLRAPADVVIDDAPEEEDEGEDEEAEEEEGEEEEDEE